MFLNQLSHSAVKKLALELAFLISISEEKENKIHTKYEILYGNFLDNEQLSKLRLTAEELDLTSYLSEILIYNDNKELDPFEGIFAEMFQKEESKGSLLGATLKITAKKIIEKYSQNLAVRNEVYNRITKNGSDMLASFELSKEEKIDRINNEMIHLPLLKKEIIQSTSSHRIKMAKPYLNERDKKIILFLLLEMAFTNDVFCHIEKDLVKYITKEMNLDEEYIDEFLEPIKILSLSIREISELINE